MNSPPAPPPPPADDKVVPAVTLFAGRKEVVLEYEGVRYRLRITKRGKLILQK